MGITTSTAICGGVPSSRSTEPQNLCSGLLECTPVEILDQILSLLSSPNDLLSFALTSRYAHALVVPHHLEYRVIQAVGPSMSVWSHLTKKADRTRNIREVCIDDDWMVGSSRKCIPTGVVDEPISIEADSIGLSLENLAQAVRNMHNLEVFRWRRLITATPATSWYHRFAPNDLEKKRLRETEVFKALSHIKTLKTVELVGHFSLEPYITVTNSGQSLIEEVEAHPLWTFSRVESLKLGSYQWLFYLGDDRLSRLLTYNNIQSLDIAIDLALLAQHGIILPCLKTLVSSLNTRECAPALLADRGKFLAAHPTIEELSWYHDSPLTFPQERVCLPNLTRLRAHRVFLLNLATKECTSFDELAVDYFDNLTLGALKNSCSGLRKLVLDELHGEENLQDLADASVFPSLRILSIGRMRTCNSPSFWNLAKLTAFLRSFSSLEALQAESMSMWDTFSSTSRPTLHHLVESCPTIRILDIQHPCFSESKRIKVNADGGYNVSMTCGRFF